MSTQNTPLEIEILLWYYWSPNDYPKMDSPAFIDAARKFTKLGLLETSTSNTQMLKPNRKLLQNYIDRILEIPFTEEGNEKLIPDNQKILDKCIEQEDGLKPFPLTPKETHSNTDHIMPKEWENKIEEAYNRENLSSEEAIKKFNSQPLKFTKQKELFPQISIIKKQNQLEVDIETANDITSQVVIRLGIKNQ